MANLDLPTIRERARMVAADAQSDASNRDGMVFNGVTVGTALGELAAQVYALAMLTDALAAHIGELTTHG